MTAMRTPLGLVQMMVVPMGWTNDMAVLQGAMSAVLKEFIPERVEVFLDDFPIKGSVERDEMEVFPGVRKFVVDHMSDVRDVLVKLDDANLMVSGTKSHWGVSSIKILGFICDKDGRRPDPRKLEKLMIWPSPLKSITEVTQFLGVVGYLRIFIKAYGEKAEPLRRLLRKSEGWIWGEEQAAAMEALKEEFCEGGQVLGVSFFEDEENRPFIVSTDAGPYSLGGLLSQKDGEGKERTLRFESRTLNPTERNYSQFKKEVLGVLHCLKAFRHYIYGRRFPLRVDPTAVATILQKDFSLTDPTIARWMIHIRLYDYRVERLSWTKKQAADGLSRLPIREEDLTKLEELTLSMAGESCGVGAIGLLVPQLATREATSFCLEGRGGGNGTVVEVDGLVDVVVGVEEDGRGVLLEAVVEEGVVCTVEDGVVCTVEDGGAAVVTIVMEGMVPSIVVMQSHMDDMLAFMSSREAVTEVRRVLSAWRMAKRSGVAVFAGGCSPARLRAMLSTESVRMSNMLMEDAATSREEGVEDVA
ncbi:hypothetical protein CBR_g25906 [Chara braunii]|uniref:Reverse transcriptase RNase H-like domain-containing protein n=1 Tax=Chara braunii TaxID=69332 RepID=A0A388L6P8_CHABU|nr:hypothetical protein CBR_g25906 [Chara braunii]|eukprot:GBG77975.1 hypothetical protein CBR_g25906 [Chara braunii]